MPFTFVHTADLHLDCPFDGISEPAPEIADALKMATFSAFGKIVDLCIEHDAAFLLIAGDAYNSEDRSLGAQLRFRDGLSRLAQAGIPAYVAHGNHDPTAGWSASLTWPDNVHFFSHKRVETIEVAYHGQPIATVSGISYQRRDVKDNLSLLFPDVDGHLYSIALLHCSCGSGNGHEPYSACAPSDLDHGFDYWALGHVHTRSILRTADPIIAYPGNPQGLNPNETGPRGCYVVHVDDNNTASLEFVETGAIRWYVEPVDLTGISSEDDLLSRLGECKESIRDGAGRPSIVRFVMRGRTALHSTLRRQGVLQDILEAIREGEPSDEHFVWVESIVDDTRPEIDLQERRNSSDFVGDFLRMIDEAKRDPVLLAELAEEVKPLFDRARKHLRQPDEDQLISWLDTAESYGLDALLADEGTQQ